MKVLTLLFPVIFPVFGFCDVSNSFAPLDVSLTDHSQLNAMAKYHNLAAFGITSRAYEGEDILKEQIFESGGNVVSEKEFKRLLEAAGLSIGHFSRTNRREYPNQDNFLVDIFLGADQKPLFSLNVIWDGHGPCGHILTEFFRRSVQRTFRIELQEFLDDSAKIGSGLNTYIRRRERMQNIVEILFRNAQEDYNMHVLYIDEPKWSVIRQLLQSLPSDISEGDCKESGATMSLTFVDHYEESLYVANLGDSPMFGKLLNHKKMTEMYEEHNVSSKKERDTLIRQFNKSRYSFVRREAYTPKYGGCVTKYHWMSEDPVPRGRQKEIHTIRLVYYPHPDYAFDFRIDGLQIRRLLGHWSDGNAIGQDPYVRRINLSEVDYILMGSDGLTHKVSEMTFLHERSRELLKRNRPKHLEEDLDRYMKNTRIFETKSEKKFLATCKNEDRERVALEELEKFGDVYEKAEGRSTDLMLDILQYMVEAHSGRNMTGVCTYMYHASRNPFSKDQKEIDQSDDVTVIAISFNPGRKAMHEPMDPDDALLKLEKENKGTGTNSNAIGVHDSMESKKESKRVVGPLSDSHGDREVIPAEGPQIDDVESGYSKSTEAFQNALKTFNLQKEGSVPRSIFEVTPQSHSRLESMDAQSDLDRKILKATTMLDDEEFQSTISDSNSDSVASEFQNALNNFGGR